MTDNFDMKNALQKLSELGMSPDQLGPEKMEMLRKFSETISDPSKMTQENAVKLMESLGFKPPVKQQKISTSIGRNAKCPCNSGKKYKKCCAD
jgi:uncharacterized protein YecA (UPF0149 family)